MPPQAASAVIVEPKPTEPPPPGARRGDEKVPAGDLAKACDVMCGKAVECAPGGVNLTKETCAKNCNAVPGGAAMQAAVDHMSRCAATADCTAFMACSAGGGQVAPQAAPAAH